MNKKIVRLSESDLCAIIQESVEQLLKEAKDWKDCRFEVCQIKYQWRCYDWENPDIAQPFFGFTPNQIIVKAPGSTHEQYRRLKSDPELCMIGRLWWVDDMIIVTYIPVGEYQEHYEDASPLVIQMLKNAYMKGDLKGKEVYFCNAWKNPESPMRLPL